MTKFEHESNTAVLPVCSRLFITVVLSFPPKRSDRQIDCSDEKDSKSIVLSYFYLVYQAQNLQALKLQQTFNAE